MVFSCGLGIVRAFLIENLKLVGESVNLIDKCYFLEQHPKKLNFLVVPLIKIGFQVLLFDYTAMLTGVK